HVERGGLAPEFDVAECSVDRQRVNLVRLDPIDKRADVKDACRFEPSHGEREGDDNRPKCAPGKTRRHWTCSAEASAEARVEAMTRRRIRASTRSMTSSGVDVPAVSPTMFAASNHSGLTSASVST